MRTNDRPEHPVEANPHQPPLDVPPVRVPEVDGDLATPDGLGNSAVPPALLIAIAVAAGILGDRHVFQWNELVWLSIAALAVALWAGLFACRRYWWSSLLLLAACAGLGGARHHWAWTVIPADDIARYADDEPRIVRVQGIILTPPEIHEANAEAVLSAWPQPERSICRLECHSLATADGPQEFSGQVRLEVSGRIDDIPVGSLVTIHGRLARPSVPHNPGGFDFRDYLRRQGIRAVLRAGYPEAVEVIGQANGFQLRQLRAEIRQKCNNSFELWLNPNIAAVAKALLLGDRSGMRDDVRTMFVETGTMHLLAISGLHVGILAGFLWCGCRLVNLSPLQTALVLLLGVGFYAFITDARPPVLRALILIVITVVGMPSYRRIQPWNTLAIAAIVLLAWKPTDLFDVGAQLSFLAVIAILWSLGFQQTLRRRHWSKIRLRTAGELSSFDRGRSELWLNLKLGYLITASIWLFAAPLVAARFNLVAPVGLLVNVLLVPVLSAALFFGYGLLVTTLVVPVLNGVFAWGFGGLLMILLTVIRWTASFELGCLYVPDIPEWWLIGFYSALGVMVGVQCFLPKTAPSDGGAAGLPGKLEQPVSSAGTSMPLANLSTRIIKAAHHLTPRGWYGLWIWGIAGLVLGLATPRPESLKCTFLSVGHGCSVLIETPNRQTLLYDAGMISNGRRAQQTVQAVLWNRGYSRLDAILISHADIDHYNGVPGLLDAIPVGAVFISPLFLDFNQEGVATVCEAAARRNVPIKFVGSGDRLNITGGVDVRILRPLPTSNIEEDNANSVVLLIEYAGRRILLTGDLEGGGMSDLLSMESRPVDVLMSPHHGSLRANPPELANWASPRWVVLSSGYDGPVERLQDIYTNGTEVLSTARSGAVTFEINAGGEISCHRQLLPK